MQNTQDKERDIIGCLAQGWMALGELGLYGHLSYNDVIEFLRSKGLDREAEILGVALDMQFEEMERITKNIN